MFTIQILNVSLYNKKDTLVIFSHFNFEAYQYPKKKKKIYNLHVIFFIKNLKVEMIFLNIIFFRILKIIFKSESQSVKHKKWENYFHFVLKTRTKILIPNMPLNT